MEVRRIARRAWSWVYSWIRRRLRPWLAVSAVLLVVLGVLATQYAVRWSFGGAHLNSGALHETVRISTANAAQLNCPTDTAFSPDGTRLAVLGTLLPCPQSALASHDHAKSSVALYDPRDGDLINVMPLEPLLDLDALAVTGRAQSYAILYGGLTWSPDATTLALSYTVFGEPGHFYPDSVLDAGVLLLHTDARPATILRGDSGFFSTSSGVSVGYPVWNLADGTETPSFLPEASLAYAWNTDETPVAVASLGDVNDHLPVIAGPRYPVGIPSGDSPFTIWQPGLVVGPASSEPRNRHSLFLANFPAWSADGERLTYMVTGVALPDSSGLGTASNASKDHPPIAPVSAPGTLPLAPARDAALDAVQRLVGAQGWALVAWNASGTTLASVNCFAPDGQTLEIRDTANGDVIGATRLRLPAGDEGCRAENDANSAGGYPHPDMRVVWSPSAETVAVTDRAAGTVTLWTVTPPTNA